MCSGRLMTCPYIYKYYIVWVDRLRCARSVSCRLYRVAIAFPSYRKQSHVRERQRIQVIIPTSVYDRVHYQAYVKYFASLISKPMLPNLITGIDFILKRQVHVKTNNSTEKLSAKIYTNSNWKNLYDALQLVSIVAVMSCHSTYIHYRVLFYIRVIPAEEQRATNDVSMFLKGLCLVTYYMIKTLIISLPPNTCCQVF
jgi:hypothetical protein